MGEEHKRFIFYTRQPVVMQDISIWTRLPTNHSTHARGMVSQASGTHNPGLATQGRGMEESLI